MNMEEELDTIHEAKDEPSVDIETCEDYSTRVLERQKRNEMRKKTSIVVSIINAITNFLPPYNKILLQDFQESFEHIQTTLGTIDPSLSLTYDNSGFVQCTVNEVKDSEIFGDFGRDVIELFIQAHGVEIMDMKLKNKNVPYNLGMLSVVPANMCGMMNRCPNGFNRSIVINTSTGPIECHIYVPKKGADSEVISKSNIAVSVNDAISLDLMITVATAQISNFCRNYNLYFAPSYISDKDRLDAIIYLQSEIYKSCNDTLSFVVDEIYSTRKNLMQLIRPQNDKAYYYLPNEDENMVKRSVFKAEYRQQIVPVYGVYVVHSHREGDDFKYSLSNTMEYSASGPRCKVPGFDNLPAYVQKRFIGESVEVPCDTIDRMTDNIKSYNILWDKKHPTSTQLYWLEQIDITLENFVQERIISPLTRNNLIVYWITNMNVESPENYLTELILYFGIILGYCIEIIDPSCRCSTKNASEYKCFDLAYQGKCKPSKNSRLSYILNTAVTDATSLAKYRPCSSGWEYTDETINNERIRLWLKILNHTEVDDMLEELRMTNVVGKDLAGIVKMAYNPVRAKTASLISKHKSKSRNTRTSRNTRNTRNTRKTTTNSKKGSRRELSFDIVKGGTKNRKYRTLKRKLF